VKKKRHDWTLTTDQRKALNLEALKDLRDKLCKKEGESTYRVQEVDRMIRSLERHFKASNFHKVALYEFKVALFTRKKRKSS
jgi:hypothetical protein